MSRDAHATMLERKIDAFRSDQLERMDAQAENFGVFKTEVRDGFARLFDVLKAIERHETTLQDHQRQLNEQEQARFKLEDRVAPLERQYADVLARVKQLEGAAAKRLRKP